MPVYEAMVQLSVTLEISGGWSLYPRGTACGWSGSSLPPCNPCPLGPCKALWVPRSAEHVPMRLSFVKQSVAVVLLKLFLLSSYRLPV